MLQLAKRQHSFAWSAVAGLMASAMLLLKALLLVPAAAAGVALLWGQEWTTRQHRTVVTGLDGLIPGVGWHLWYAHNRGSQAPGSGAEMAPGGFCSTPAKAVTSVGGCP